MGENRHGSKRMVMRMVWAHNIWRRSGPGEDVAGRATNPHFSSVRAHLAVHDLKHAFNLHHVFFYIVRISP